MKNLEKLSTKMESTTVASHSIASHSTASTSRYSGNGFNGSSNNVIRRSNNYNNINSNGRSINNNNSEVNGNNVNIRDQYYKAFFALKDSVVTQLGSCQRNVIVVVLFTNVSIEWLNVRFLWYRHQRNDLGTFHSGPPVDVISMGVSFSVFLIQQQIVS